MSVLNFTANDIVVSALRQINALEAGENPSPLESQDALNTLNYMVDSWSLEHLFVYASVENILYFTPGQYQYSIGNPQGGFFVGTLTQGSNLITSVGIPSSLIAGGTITGSSGAIPANTTVLSFGGNTVTMSANALFTPTAPDQITYTTPGQFGIARPLRITNAFTRITASGSTGLDYPIEILHRDQYTSVGLKSVSGPWPTFLYYDPTFPLGTLYFYPNPSGAGELHLWTDTILAQFASLTQPLNLPQGYVLALIKNLALQLAPEYGKNPGRILEMQAGQSKHVIKSLNAVPAVVAAFDQHILKGRRTDASWILDGGFRT